VGDTARIHASGHGPQRNADEDDDMILVYLPKERILAEADAYTPPVTPTTPLIAPTVPYAVSLYANIKRVGLNVGTIAPLHEVVSSRWTS
jgi:hypothetical protein